MQFDLINAAGAGYQWVWQERRYLARMAMLPIFVKCACYMLVLALGFDAQNLNYTLVLLPAFFAEGWLIAQSARTQITAERWPVPLPPPELLDERDIEKFLPRAKAILACIITFALLKFLSNGLGTLGLYLASHVDTEAAANTPMSSLSAMLSLVVVIFALWAFRFIYIYVAMVVLMPVRDYMRVFAPFSASVKLLALWLITNIPGLFLVMMITASMASSFADPALMPANVKFLLMGIGGIFEMILALISTAAFASAFQPILRAYYKP